MSRDEDEEVVGSRSPWPLLFLLGAIFLPGAIIAFALWGMLRYFRQRPSVVALAGSVVSLISVIVITINVRSIASNTEGIIGLDGNTIVDSLITIIPIWVGVSMIIGSLAGWIFALYSSRQMKKSPHLTELSGDWRYGFKYRRTPREALARKKNIKKLNNGLLVSEHKAPIGIDEKTDEVVFRYDSEAKKHTLVTGASGSGKSISLQSLIHSDIENGKTVVVIDFKRDPKFASKLAAWSHMHDREFFHFVNGEPKDYDIPYSKGQCLYDPLAGARATARADMLMGMREYDTSAAVYEAAMQQLLQVSFNMLEHADREKATGIDWDHGGIAMLTSVVRGNGLANLVAANTVQMPPGSTDYVIKDLNAGGIEGAREIYVNSPVANEAMELMEDLRVKNSPNQRALQELQGQLRTITASEYGRWMRTSPEQDVRSINLLDLTSVDGNVVLFSLNSDSEPKFAQYVGSMIFSNLTNVSAERRNLGSKNHVNVYVDEFQAVPPTSVKSLLEKSRASGIAMTLALQSFDQIIASSDKNGEAHLNSILDTCSNFITHAGATDVSAKKISEILGKDFFTVYSKVNANDSSFLSFNWAKSQSSKVTARQEERWIFPPSEFMKLSSPDKEANDNKATAVWTTKTSAESKYASGGGGTARTVWMIPDLEVLEDYYQNPEHPIIAPREPARKKKLVTQEPELQVTPAENDDSFYADLAQQSSSYENDDPHYEYEDTSENLDDEWDFEDIPDSELDPEDVDLPETAERVEPPATQRESVMPAIDSLARVRTAQEEKTSTSDYNLDDLFSTGVESKREAKLPAPKKVAKKDPKPAEERLPDLSMELPPVSPPARLPGRPGGLPTRPGA